MITRLRRIWEMISTSLWFVPGLLIVAAVALAWFVVPIRLEIDESVWWLHNGSTENASNLMSSLLTSMITMVTLIISITMVVLTLAANNLGPRLIPSFISDKNTQLILGFYLATIVYLILVLRIIDNEWGEDLPHLAITLGSVFVLISMPLLLYFVHHLARSIIADTVIKRIGNDFNAAIARMLPEQDSPLDEMAPPDDDAEDSAAFSLPEGGYIQTLDYGALLRYATTENIRIRIDFQPGHHLLPSCVLGHVYPASAAGADLDKAIADNIVIGAQRTAAQDMEYAIRQLVEIAVRALSTGINDSFTAMTVIDQLGLSIELMMQRGTAQSVWCDENGMVRLACKTTDFQGITDAAFNQIRQSATGQPAVLIHLYRLLSKLLNEHSRHDEHRRILTIHLNLVMQAAKRSIPDPYDLEAVAPG